MLLVVEPGVINNDVTAAASPHGLHYAPDPSSQSICTIGGNVAFNSGGAHCLKYGMTSNHVLGVKVITASGEIVEFGGTRREQIGPDWTGLFVGNEGLFGVALEITLQLLPPAECFHTVLTGYATLEHIAVLDSIGATPHHRTSFRNKQLELLFEEELVETGLVVDYVSEISPATTLLQA